MRDGVPSITAAAVSLFRAVASLPGSRHDFVNDEGMRVLAPSAARRALRVLGLMTARRPGLLDAAAGATFGLFEHVALRTAAIDASLRREAEASLPQLVILGAGLDARAFRMPELASSVVFEVDFPSTQSLKRSRAGALTPAAREVRFVPIDFQRDSLDDVLERAGHRRDQRTVWIWEGVTMYLERDAIGATLDVVAARSSPGSVLLMTYGMALEGLAAPLEPLASPALGLLGEPLLGRMSRAEAHALLDARRLLPSEDTGSRDWARAHLRGKPSRITIGERLVRSVRA